MISTTLSHKAPLIYYSFTQIIQEEYGTREIHAANKISIRKHDDYDKDGIELLMYNCALSPKSELCNGIRQTHIVEDSHQINFHGKGLSGNGVPLNNLIGCYFNKNGMIEVITGKTTRKYIYHYLNCYRDEHPEVFNVNNLDNVFEFLRSTKELLQDIPYDINNPWYRARACVISHYGKRSLIPHIFSIEKRYEDVQIKESVKVALLKLFEEQLDGKFHEAYQHYRNNEEFIFKQKLNGMIDLLGVYYLIYNTLL